MDFLAETPRREERRGTRQDTKSRAENSDTSTRFAHTYLFRVRGPVTHTANWNGAVLERFCAASKVPQRNVEVYNRVGPTGDTELDRRASDKTHEEFALGLMDGPYNSLEECPGQHKVLVRKKPRWQSGDVRNIDDCSENGINETF